MSTSGRFYVLLCAGVISVLIAREAKVRMPLPLRRILRNQGPARSG
jgi:hypothetical protein